MITKTKITEAGPGADHNAPDQLVRAGLYLVIVAAIVVSGDTLIYLASQAGWTDWRAWLLPLLIDLPGFLGGRIWLRRKATNPQTRAYARRLTLAALGASLAGNVTGHLVHAGHLPAGLALVIVAAMVAPIVLAAVLHLDALLTPIGRRNSAVPAAEATAAGQAAIEPTPTRPARPDQLESGRPEPTAPRPTAAVAKRTPAKSTATGPAAGRKGTKKARARELWDAARAEGRTLTPADLVAAVDADDSGARRWVREFRNADKAEQTGPAGDRQDAEPDSSARMESEAA